MPFGKGRERKVSGGEKPSRARDRSTMGFLDLQLHRCRAEKQLWKYRRILKRPEYQGLCSFKFQTNFFKKHPSLHSILSMITTLSSCVFVGLLFYAIFTIKYATFPREVGTFIGLFVMVVVCSMQLLPVIRAIILVAIPSLMTSQIRAILMLMLVTWAFQVPAMNITKNIQLTTASTLCVQEKIKTQLKDAKAGTGEKLRSVPRQVFDKFLGKAQIPFEKLRELMKLVDESVNKMLAWQRTMFLQVNDMLTSCNENARRPYYRCVEIVDKSYYDCMDGKFELVCSPILLLRKMCSATRILTLNCEWPQYLKKSLEETVGTVVKSGLKDSISLAKNTAFYKLSEAKMRETKNVELNVTHVYEHNSALAINLGDVKALLRDKVSGLENFIKGIIYVLGSLVFPMILWPFLTATFYVFRFYRNPKYDNYFISAQLDEIELERRKRGRTTVLPLMIPEKKTLIRLYSLSMSRKERPYLWFSLLMTFVGAIVPLVIIMMDILLFKLMNRTFKFFSGELSLGEVPGHYELKIAGKGFMQELLQSLLEVFQPLHQNLQDTLWKGCFEEPSPPDYLLFQLMFLCFLAAIILCFIQVYAKRWRHIIAEMVFPEKVRLRALKLYSGLLELRMRTLDKVAGKHKNLEGLGDMDDNEIDDGRIQTCIRCNTPDLEIKMGGKASRVCVECNEFYCLDCYDQITKCISCGIKLIKVEDEIHLYEDSSSADSSDEQMEGVKVNGQKIGVEDISNILNKARKAKRNVAELKENIDNFNVLPSFIGRDKEEEEKEVIQKFGGEVKKTKKMKDIKGGKEESEKDEDPGGGEEDNKEDDDGEAGPGCKDDDSHGEQRNTNKPGGDVAKKKKAPTKKKEDKAKAAAKKGAKTKPTGKKKAAKKTTKKQKANPKNTKNTKKPKNQKKTKNQQKKASKKPNKPASRKPKAGKAKPKKK